MRILVYDDSCFGTRGASTTGRSGEGEGSPKCNRVDGDAEEARWINFVMSIEVMESDGSR